MQFEVVEPVAQQSYLQFIFASLGLRYTVLLAVSSLVAFVVVAVMLLRGRGPWAVGATLLAVSLPTFVGVLAFVGGALSSFMVIARSNAQPKPEEWAEGLAMALVSINVGMLLTGVLLLVALIGLTVRALTEPAVGHQFSEFLPPQLPQRAPAKAV